MMRKNKWIFFSIFLYFIQPQAFAQSNAIDYVQGYDFRHAAIDRSLDMAEYSGSIASQVSFNNSTDKDSNDFIHQTNQSGISNSVDIGKKDDVRISGVVHSSVGIDSHGDAIFTRANADLNEKNFRLLSDQQLNNFSNTYDSALYSRLKVVIDAAIQQSISMHLNVTADPWSYTGKSKLTTVTSYGGDIIDVQYLFWGNTGYTLNRNIRTRGIGTSIALPELKVKGDHVPAITLTDIYDWGDGVDIPEMRLGYSFQPVRELWFDVKPTDTFSLRFFPMAYQDQAFTSNDPLKLSNNKTWWEESPWLRQWLPGSVNPVASPQLFTQGQWDRSLAFFTRDSDGQRLTALRGFSMDLDPTEDMSINAVVASPKTLWQDYSEYTAIPGSVRVKQSVGDQAYIGVMTNIHLGYLDNKVDAKNFVESIDAAINPLNGIKFMAQAATSQSANDIRSDVYETKKKGQAYFASVEAASDQEEMLKKDYFALKLVEGDQAVYKTRLYFARMDKFFENTLSNYHETRKDAYWGRHITFYPSTYRNLPGSEVTTSEYDKSPFAMGDGIDYGREVVGWRGDTILMDGLLAGMGNIRRVMTTEGKHVETVIRTEWTHQTTEKLTTKALLVWQGMPKTQQGIDPFIVDGNTGEPLVNAAIENSKDADLSTRSLGARYELTDWAVLNGVWEHTNDSSLAEDNFPQGVLNSSYFTTFQDGGRWFSKEQGQVYSQGFFAQPPYAYQDIFKAGILLKPTEKWNIYMDYTHNPNKFAGNIDDNLNHFGLESSYLMNERVGFFGRYTFSRWNDINTLVNGHELKYQSYNNFFLEARYLAVKDQKFSLMYGVGPSYTVDTSASSPTLAYYAAPVISTQHMIRMIYEKKF